MAVQNTGWRFRGKAALLCVIATERDVPRVGYTVSRKVGGAVIRNRTRRRMREIVRLHQDALCKGFDYVFIAAPSAARTEYRALEQEMLELLQRLARRASQPTP